ncbi:MAG: sigma-70 family RNA polymerase sigma factor [Leptolyngbyaceae cyanobacterium SM2_5_2]|nr:sigma-70 family RNA polymerase sigma factor [Leptolyngbyaceae cyanobacterium SM2_5_2]
METPPGVDDAGLISRVAQRDQAALSLLYDRYARIIYSLAFKSLRSVEESEEVVLDVFAQVWRIAERYDPQKGRADTWLFTLARSRLLDRLRKVKRSGSSTTVSMDAEEIQPQAANVDIFENVVIRERRSQVIAALKTLPDEQKLVLELAYYQGLTQSEIAAQTGLALGTVKTRIRLGLSKLKSALSPQEHW